VSPTLDELFPPIEPQPSFRKRHGRRLIIVGACVAAIVLVAVVRQIRQPDAVIEAKVGDCLIGELGADRTFKSGEIVDCSQLHSREVYAVGSTDKEISLLDAPLDPELVRVCETEVDPAIVEVLSTAGDVSLGYLVSTNRTGRIVCVVFGPERTTSYVQQSRQSG
jgi:hypothetical protein